MKYLNLNDCVWVELNDYGWKQIEKYYSKLFECVPDKDKHIKDSVQILKSNTSELFIDGEKRKLTLFQIHSLMNIFGEIAFVGGENFIIDNKIYLTLE